MTIHVPSSLTEEQIRKFQGIYQRQHGESISKEEAEEQGLRLMRFVAFILEGHPKFQKKQSEIIDS